MRPTYTCWNTLIWRGCAPTLTSDTVLSQEHPDHRANQLNTDNGMSDVESPCQ